MSSQNPDPILVKRAKIAHLTKLGKQIGYGCFVLSSALFAYGLIVQFRPAIANSVIALLIIGSIVLAPAIVFGYAVKAADRADRQQSW